MLVIVILLHIRIHRLFPMLNIYKCLISSCSLLYSEYTVNEEQISYVSRICLNKRLNIYSSYKNRNLGETEPMLSKMFTLIHNVSLLKC